MDFLFKSVAACVITALFAVAMKKTVPELAFVLQITGVILVLLLAIRLLAPLAAFLKSSTGLFQTSGVYVQPIVKAAVIGVFTKIGHALCKDAGQAAFASVIELVGTITILLAALPLMQLFVQTIGAYL